MFNLILPVLLAQVISYPGVAAPQRAVSPQEVMAMFAELPAYEGGKVGQKVGHWEKRKDAMKIAKGIALAAPSREWAALEANYAVFESNLVANARGDRDSKGIPHAFGTFQLHSAPIYVADDPIRAAAYWMNLALKNEALCQMNPPQERLAALASGSCSRGRVLVRRREALAAAVLEALEVKERAAEEAETAAIDRGVETPLAKE